MKPLKVYQYNDPRGAFDPLGGTGETRWIAARSEAIANAFALSHNWEHCGGLIWDAQKTAELLFDWPRHGRGIDFVIEGGVVVGVES